MQNSARQETLDYAGNVFQGQTYSLILPECRCQRKMFFKICEHTVKHFEHFGERG
jgi:hypothetical protein